MDNERIVGVMMMWMGIVGVLLVASLIGLGLAIARGIGILFGVTP